MKSILLRLAWTFLSLLLVLQMPLAALACPTCGCSELCPLTMLDEETHDTSADKDSLLSNSIWGNLILKIAYNRDPQLQKLSRRMKGVNIATGGAIAAGAVGIVPQSIVSIYTLNPPDGVQDSYAPGSVGVALETVTNVALIARLGLSYGLRKKVRQRQTEIRSKVESILQHLEYSQSNCPDARKQLTELIGEKAADECLSLWQSSHALASVPAAGS
jgi:hypothetical protein